MIHRDTCCDHSKWFKTCFHVFRRSMVSVDYKRDRCAIVQFSRIISISDPSHRLRRCSSTFSKPRSEWLKLAINAAAADYRLIWIVGRVVRRKWFYWTASQPAQPQTPSIGKWPVVDSPEPHNISRRIQHNKTTTFYAIISHHNCSAIKLLKPGSASCDLRLSFAKMPGEKFTRKISWDDSSVSVNWLLLSNRIYEICFLSLFFPNRNFRHSN